jgi:hypothetical protein
MAENPIATKSVEKKIDKRSSAYQRDKDRELVKGIFHFYEVPGGILEFNFKKHKGDPIEFYSLKDGEIRSLPLGVAKHLNTAGKYPEHEFIPGPDGKQSASTVRVGRMVSRFGFESLEFLPVEEIGDAEPVASIYTAERI